MTGGDHASKHNKLLLLRTREASDFELETLVEWSRDEESQVRDWATFLIGSQLNADTPEVRQALRDRLNDPDFDTRCEALVGLARRRDVSGVEQLKRSLQGDMVSTMMIEAAGYYGRSDFVPILQELQSWWDVDDELLKKAIKHCSGEQRDEWWDSDRCSGNDNG